MTSKIIRILTYFVTSVTIPLVTSSPVKGEDWQQLTVLVDGIEAYRGGQLQVFVFHEDGFPIKHERALKSYVRPVGVREISISLEVPTNGPFALKVHHDEDGNSKVTKNWTGIFPVEGFGFSAGARMNVTPPSFAAAKMTLPETGTTSISMQYP